MLDVDDLARLDRATLAPTRLRGLLAAFPNLAIFPGTALGRHAARGRDLASGGQRFVVAYALHDGCHACTIVGNAAASPSTSTSTGKFVGDRGRAASGAPALDAGQDRPMAFRRALGTFDATMVVVGGIIGAGIFINPYLVAQRLPSAGLGSSRPGPPAARSRWPGRSRSPSSRRSSRGRAASTSTCARPTTRSSAFSSAGRRSSMIQGGGIAAVAITFAQYTLRLAGAPARRPAPARRRARSSLVAARQRRRRQARQPAAERPRRR